MGKKRRLGDLYRTYKIVEVDDGRGDKVTVALVKINRPDTEAAALYANAARARMLMHRNDPTSDVWLEGYGEISELERSGLYSILTADEMAQKRLSAEAEEAAQSRWADDEYLDGLRKLWDDELMQTWAAHPEDPDAARVYKELNEFRDAVEARLAGEAEDLADAYEHLDDEELKAKVTAKLIERTANVVWFTEFEMWRVYYGTREVNDRSLRYFANFDEVKDLDDRVYTKLRLEYDDLSLEPVEGKEPPATPGSSPPTESAAEAEPSKDSGPEKSTVSKTSPTSS